MYQVQAIVNRRVNPQTNRTQYLVKWCGYSDSENTWEPESNLKFVKNLINNYLQKSDLKAQCLGNSDNAAQSKSSNFQESDYDENPDLEIFEEEEQSEEQKTNKKQDKKMAKKQFEQAEPGPNKNQISKSKENYKPESRMGKDMRNSEQKLINKLSLREVDLKKQEPKLKPNWSMFQKTNKKAPPPLPPDFTSNKERYSQSHAKGNAQYSKPSNMNFPSKHKFIQKERLNHHLTGNKLYSKPDLHQTFPSKFMNKPKPPPMLKNSSIINNQQFKSYQKIIPPPPPPRFNKNEPTISKYKPSQQHQWQNNSYFDSSVSQPNNKIKKKKEYEKDEHFTYKYESQPFESFSNGFNYEVQYNKGSQIEKQEGLTFRNAELKVNQVKGMQKVGDSFIYIVETNQGELQLERKDMVPRFSTELVNFYQRHLTLQD